MSRHRWPIVVAVAFTVLLCASLTALAETRTWTDSTGKYKIEADFVEILDGQVKLERPDGKRVSLPLGKLSKDDQAYLRELVKNRPAGGASDNPFQEEAASDAGGSNARPRPMRGRPSARRGRFGQDDEPQYNVGDKVEVEKFGKWELGEIVGFDENGSWAYVKLDSGAMVNVLAAHSIRHYDPSLGPLAGVKENELTRVDLSRIRRIVPLGDSSGRFKPDPAAAAAPAWQPRPVGLNPKGDFFDHVVGISFATGGTAAVVGHADRRGAHEGALSRIELCDLKSGRVTAMLRGPRSLKHLSVSPSGQKLITISDEETFVSGPLQLWEMAGDELKHVASWYVTSGERGEQVEWIGWVDDERIMTVDRNNLTVWSTSGPKGLYQITGAGMKAPAFSPGGKQFAIGTDKGFSIHDVASGDLLTRVKMDPGFNRRVAFSPSGMLLAVTGSSTVEVYDLKTGERGIVAYAAHAGHDGNLCWLDEEHVLVGGSDLIHLPSQMTVWTYEHNAENVVQIADRIWYVFSDIHSGTMGLLPFDLPHSAVKPVKDSELVLKPGDEVAIQSERLFDFVRDPAGGEGAAAPVDQLTEALTSSGFIVVNDSNKKLIGRTTSGETKEIAYRMFGAGIGEVQRTSYTQRVFELELVVDGQVVWQRKRVMDAPHHLQLQEGESVDQAVQRVLMQDNGFFRSTIPSRILPTSVAEARTSHLTIDGIQ